MTVLRGTVRKVIRSHETEFKYEREVQTTLKLGGWFDVLTATLVKEAKLARRERGSQMPF